MVYLLIAAAILVVAVALLALSLCRAAKEGDAAIRARERPRAPARRVAPMSQADWPAHLRDDAPYLACDTCRRHTWPGDMAEAVQALGTACGFPQPDGSACAGTFCEIHVPR